MKRFATIQLELVVFLSGVIVMMVELVASRVLAPYFGNSLIVWTNLIGIILGALSLGYFIGGRLADRLQSYKRLALLILFAGIMLAVTAFTKEWVLTHLPLKDVRLGSLLATVVLFGPTSVALGTVSPYAARLRLTTIANGGRTVGKLYALATLGSIVGTFAAGFFFIPHFGNTALLYSLALALVGTAVWHTVFLLAIIPV